MSPRPDVLAPLVSTDGTLDVSRAVDEANHWALFQLSGTLDEGSAPQLLELLVAAARVDAVDLVIADLLQVPWIGGPGARCLEAGARATGRHGAQLVLTRPTLFVRRVLEVVGLAGLVTDEAEAGWHWSDDL
ncbi:STAS domain-containing protein [Cryptosporangium arvum]|uniref:Anti-anti-sigma regulatory factor (Antagonist of anti-sigma factor) n=1 Tax=Cryptosporangium arvum DSM 44712 TaxID=927661 RepID=A0A010Z1J8_9ACTN|nr:STAS domain-containing protein [Cryptosporangium arvum]EXG81283.1 anti-anti-sigma regulatory factor (antagonist of anti-sigma factor) [Cryptosporangium arvum DSM 44712]